MKGRMQVLAVATPATTPGSTLIDGIGDEVIYFFGFSVLLILLVVAWTSTSVSDHSVFRAAVLVIERRRRSTRNRRRPAGPNPNATVDSPAAETSTGAAVDGDDGSSVAASINPAPDVARDEINPICETKEKTEDLGSDGRELRQRTSASLQSPDDRFVVQEGGGTIRVRLKFLNDTLKEVNARLEDQLGHFKRCHFSHELSDNKVVRLIFNGQLLNRDQETLRNYGLVDNCVVHCHISTTPLSATVNRSQTTTTTMGTPLLQQSGGNHITPQVELDLSRLMLPLFGLILGLIWCCRIQYRQYFNATSTFALLCITGLFIVSVVAICMPTRPHLQR